VAFIDGSNVTLLDSTVAEKIGATGQRVPLCCNWSAGISWYDDRSEKLCINISKNFDEYPRFTMTNIRKMEILYLPVQKFDVTNLSVKYPYIKQAEIIGLSVVRPLLLIRSDSCHLIVAKEVIQVISDAPAISNTKFVWAGNYQKYHSSIVNVCCEENDESLYQLVKSYMTLEHFGVITTTTDRRQSEEESSAQEQMEKSITKVGNHYEVCLPYGEFDVMPHNEASAYQRLRCTERKLSKIKMENQYNQKSKNTWRKVCRENYRDFQHPAIISKKPGKLSLVFDVAEC
jgi:hypothetical protein